MKKLILLLTTALIFTVSANAQDHGSDSIVLIQSADLQAGKTIPTDVRFVASGQPDEAMLQTIAELGFSAVVDLRAADEERGFDEQKAIERLGMEYVLLPIASADDITFDKAAVLDQILADNQGPVLIHCASGNRVGALFALREILLGASNDEALALGKTAGMTRLESVVRERIGEK
ncbi:MAG: tyrosine-protein phosphatase [Proteobacteria bacterium]|nr:tyrosine-protein phosphatase [Pseudomonadota bacterium]